MKYYEYKIHSYEMEIYFSAVREKIDTISILMTAIKSMLIQKHSQHIDAPNKMVLCIDKMSRIFFLSEKKIYTLVFPFTVTQTEDDYLIFNSEVVGEIDSQVATSVLNIARSVQEVGLSDLSALIEMEKENAPFQDIWALIRFLMLHEDGYVRFDHDPERVNGLRHPLNHFDIFYSNKSTFKLGLNEQANLEMFTDMLDRNSNCHFLNRVRSDTGTALTSRAPTVHNGNTGAASQ